jgi:hypothetical protein
MSVCVRVCVCDGRYVETCRAASHGPENATAPLTSQQFQTRFQVRHLHSTAVARAGTSSVDLMGAHFFVPFYAVAEFPF